MLRCGLLKLLAFELVPPVPLEMDAAYAAFVVFGKGIWSARFNVRKRCGYRSEISGIESSRDLMLDSVIRVRRGTRRVPPVIRVTFPCVGPPQGVDPFAGFGMRREPA